MLQEETLLEHISFNVADEESKLTHLNANALETRLSQQNMEGISVLPALPEAVSSQIQLEKEGIPLWKYFVVFALLFLAAEIFILQLKD